ncbi:Starch-binding associating with outer membrane [Pedobacter sp. ok626]|uniref:RagB/SusD family nutrient uptake outer membrane protein n=1 Tax=Pedobacter sp. ok626 TaxID=1761882 RepID=UPI0008845D3E|nr:RagB/SusD family nutrient uptake outer membrane protein [Pedobacter sp. ok626]SDK26780.1 Starch-binding associating with outer membrane [Pedobacter sp. ok626]
MKKNLFLFAVLYLLTTACNKLDVAPVSLVSDADVFKGASGIAAYMANLYTSLPIEDFKYGNGAGSNPSFNTVNSILNVNVFTGELFNKNLTSGDMNRSSGYWADAYALIRNANYFIATLPQYSSNFTTEQVNGWLGEARFLRAYTYYALAKRYGGVPLVVSVLTPEESVTMQRSSEQETWDFINAELTAAMTLLPATSENRGRVNKYVAAGILSRTALYAGSIAKYNKLIQTSTVGDKRIIGIPATEAVRYFKQSYNAALFVANGPYALYNQVPDKAVNFYNLFFDVSPANKESMLVKEYSLTNSAHAFDVYAVPVQMQSPLGFSSYHDPTLDLVELYDGLPRNADGSLKTIDQTTGKFAQYPTIYSFFANAEPRLLGSILVPGATFKNQVIDIRRGIYTGSSAAGISPFAGSIEPYPVVTNPYTSSSAVTAVMTASTDKLGNPVVNVPVTAYTPTGKLASGGLSGIYGSRDAGTMTGFFQRKYLDESKTASQITQSSCVQPWVELRYAEVLLNRAEAAYELILAGIATSDQGTSYLIDAYTQINAIRTRAGANLLTSAASLNDINIVRKERRKELAFENKIYWDVRRWRIGDAEIQNRVWFVLNPIYVRDSGNYIFDKRKSEKNVQFTFGPKAYYESLPSSELNRTNPALDQNTP